MRSVGLGAGWLGGVVLDREGLWACGQPVLWVPVVWQEPSAGEWGRQRPAGACWLYLSLKGFEHQSDII